MLFRMCAFAFCGFRFSYAQSYWNATVELAYTGIDAGSAYRVRLVYVAQKAPITLTAVGHDGVTALVHGPLVPNTTALCV